MSNTMFPLATKWDVVKCNLIFFYDLIGVLHNFVNMLRTCFLHYETADVQLVCDYKAMNNNRSTETILHVCGCALKSINYMMLLLKNYALSIYYNTWSLSLKKSSRDNTMGPFKCPCLIMVQISWPSFIDLCSCRLFVTYAFIYIY